MFLFVYIDTFLSVCSHKHTFSPMPKHRHLDKCRLKLYVNTNEKDGGKEDTRELKKMEMQAGLEEKGGHGALKGGQE